MVKSKLIFHSITSRVAFILYNLHVLKNCAVDRVSPDKQNQPVYKRKTYNYALFHKFVKGPS